MAGLNQVTKWNNLFWHQPHKTEGNRLKAIENNMTKDLVFILTKKECKRIRGKFSQLVKNGVGGFDRHKKRGYSKPSVDIAPSKVVRKDCQKGIEYLEKKDTYLIFLSKSTPKSTEGQKDPSGQSIFDGFIEFENMNLVFEVKTDSSTDASQLAKYESDLKKGGHYKGRLDFTWDDIYKIMTESLSTNNEIEKLLIGQYMELIEVMGLVEDFYGFKGTTPEEHNHELRNLLSRLQSDIKNGFKCDTTKKTDESWIRFSLHELNDEPHFTISRDNAELALGVTLKCKNALSVFSGPEIKAAIDKLCFWNERKEGQTNLGRTVVGALYDYRTLSGSGIRTKQATEFQVIVRLDKNIRAKSAKRRVDEFLALNPNTIQTLFGDSVQLKQIRIGITWNILYGKTKDEWSKINFSYGQVKEAFDALRPLYEAIRETHNN